MKKSNPVVNWACLILIILLIGKKNSELIAVIFILGWLSFSFVVVFIANRTVNRKSTRGSG